MNLRVLSVLTVSIIVAGCVEGDYALYNLHQPDTIYVEVPVEVPIEVEIPVEIPVEVIVEVPVPVPGEGGDVWIDSFEQPYTIDGIDIVWLIDKSGSMNQHATSVVAGIEQMMLSLPPSGWRLGITTTAWGNTSTASQFPLVPGDSVQDAWDSYNNTGNHATEAGFDALYAYLIENTYNQSWLRPDAGLLVVFVSDEDEQSNRDFANTPHGLLDFINWYGSRRPSVFLASIVNLPASMSACQWSPPAFYVGDRYIDATTAFGGVVVDICDQDWTPGVQEAANQAQPHESWELTYTPIVDSLIVFVDFVEFADWTYNGLSNAIEFDVIPPEGSLVEIGYVIDSVAGDDDDSAGN